MLPTINNAPGRKCGYVPDGIHAIGLELLEYIQPELRHWQPLIMELPTHDEDALAIDEQAPIIPRNNLLQAIISGEDAADEHLKAQQEAQKPHVGARKAKGQSREIEEDSSSRCTFPE